MVADRLKEASRKGHLNLKNAYHDASVVKSTKGATKKSDSQENTKSVASNDI